MKKKAVFGFAFLVCVFVSGYLFKKAQYNQFHPSVFPLLPITEFVKSGITICLSVITFLFILLNLFTSTLNYKRLFSFIILLAFHSFHIGFLSPTEWKHPFPASADGERGYNAFGQPLHRTSYVNAKALDFSGMSESFWNGLSHSTNDLRSYILPIATVLLDLPAIDPESFHRLHQILLFFWCVFGAFGFYLFCSISLKCSENTALLGGMGYLSLNPWFSYVLSIQSALFAGFFLTLPYLLLCIHQSFEEKSREWALRVGISFAFPFFLLSPHPETVLHGLVFSFLYYLFCLFYIGRRLSFKGRLSLSAWMILSALLLSAFRWFPLVEEKILGELTIWGHQEGTFLFETKGSFGPILRPFFQYHLIFIFVLLYCIRQKIWIKEQKAPILFFLGICSLFALCFIPGESGVLPKLITRWHIPLNFLYPHRSLSYLGLTGIILAVLALDTLEKTRCFSFATLMFLLTACLGVASLTSHFYSLPIGLTAKTILYPKVIIPFLFLFFWMSFQGRIGDRSTSLGTLGSVLLFSISSYYSESFVLLSRAKHSGNPLSNTPYISLQTLLSNYDALRFEDTASLKFISQRLCEYGKLTDKKEEYCGLPNSLLLTKAKSDYSNIDSFFLKNPNQFYPSHIRRINHQTTHVLIDFNNASLFSEIPNKYSKILPSTASDDFMQIGFAETRLIHNATWEHEIRWLAGYRPLHALYMKPGESYRNIGLQMGPKVWLYGKEVLSPLQRKIFNIGGIDYYTLTEWEYESLRSEPDLKLTHYSMPARLRPPFVLVEDTRSYGIAYFPRLIRYIPEKELWANVYPLNRADEVNLNRFNELQFSAWKQLLALPEKHSILLEDNENSGKEENFDVKDSSFSILNILGNKAAFEIDCHSDSCPFTVNLATIHGWHYYLDKELIPVRRSNFAFSTFRIPNGKHLLWMYHERTSEIIGQWISLLLLSIFSWTNLKKSIDRLRHA